MWIKHKKIFSEQLKRLDPEKSTVVLTKISAHRLMNERRSSWALRYKLPKVAYTWIVDNYWAADKATVKKSPVRFSPVIYTCECLTQFRLSRRSMSRGQAYATTSNKSAAVDLHIWLFSGSNRSEYRTNRFLKICSFLENVRWLHDVGKTVEWWGVWASFSIHASRAHTVRRQVSPSNQVSCALTWAE